MNEALSDFCFAAIDIGTNSVLLLVAGVRNGAFRVLEDRAEITRLGEGVDRTRRIGPDGEERTLRVLRSYLRRCGDLGVDEIRAVGTSALRDAANAADFRARVKRELGLDLRVLTGAEEAWYSFLAAEEGLGLRGKELLVVDVGGGSTEFVWGKEGKLRRWASLDLGTVRLTERYLLSDPVRDEEAERLIREVDSALAKLAPDREAESSFSAVVGVAGTFTTLAAVEKGLERYSHSEVHGSRLSRQEVERQVELYRSRTLAERKQIPGLEPKRADVIFAGALLILRIMAFFRADEVLVSDQGIRYGLLYERLRGFHGSPAHA